MAPVLLASSPASADPIVAGVAPAEPLSPRRAARRAEILAALREPMICPEDAESMEYWNLGTFEAFRPRNAWEDWLGQQASVMMFRISRSERIERKLRDIQALRAIDCWETDQRVAAATTAARLAEEPGRTYAELVSTPAGCDWLITRWEELAEVPVAAWTPEQTALAQMIHPGKPRDHLKPGFVPALIAGLQDLREQSRAADQALRALAEADLGAEVSPTLKQVRRDRQVYQRQLKWYIAQLHAPQPEHRTDHRYRPDYHRHLLEPFPAAAPLAPTAAEPRAEVVPPSADQPQVDARPAVTPHDENDETKPFESATAPEVEPQQATSSELAFETLTQRTERVEERKRRIDPVKAVARLRKASRRSA